VIPLSDAPPWVLEAGIDYANDEWDGSEDVTIQERGERMIISWSEYTKNGESVDSKPDSLQDIDVRNEETEGSPEAFEKELSRRD